MKKRVSILKETIKDEDRVILLPHDIIPITKKYDVLVEQNAGSNLGYADEDYEKCGAIICSKEECWEADFILKYKAPTKSEYQYLNENTKMSAIFHAEGNKELIKEMKSKKVTAYTYEFIRTDDSIFPMAFSGGEIAGKMAVMYANFFLQKQYGGAGHALFSVRGSQKAKVAVIGYGNVGAAAIKIASDLGNEVYVFGTNINKLKKLSVLMNDNVHCIESTENNLKTYLPQMNAIIGAILISTYDTNPIITEEIFNSLKKGTVIVDVTCGYGKGYIPSIDKYTSLSSPISIKNGIVCCKIDNLPSAYPLTTTQAYSKSAAEWILKILDTELSNQASPEVLQAKIFDKGEIVHDVIKKHWEYYESEKN